LLEKKHYLSSAAITDKDQLEGRGWYRYRSHTVVEVDVMWRFDRCDVNKKSADSGREIIYQRSQSSAKMKKINRRLLKQADISSPLYWEEGWVQAGYVSVPFARGWAFGKIGIRETRQRKNGASSFFFDVDF
jgi:hypothetical protein